jgi:hypothetical protein
VLPKREGKKKPVTRIHGSGGDNHIDTYNTSLRNRNRVNRNHLGILGLRIGLFCALVTKETSKDTYKNRNSLAWLKNAGSYSAVTCCTYIYTYIHTCMHAMARCPLLVAAADIQTLSLLKRSSPSLHFLLLLLSVPFTFGQSF